MWRGDPAHAPLILVVDDNRDLRGLLERELGAAGYRVALAATGEEALVRARALEPALVLLDLGLPDLDGTEVLRQLHAAPATASLGVIFLSGRTGEDERIRAFELGADDYVSKPFSVRELLLRVEAVCRRAREHSRAAERVQRAGRIEIDPAAYRVRVDGAPVPVTQTEFRLLQALGDAAGRVCTREELLRRLDPDDRPPARGRALRTQMCRIRQKLGSAAAQLETVRSIGYRLRLDR
jgi:two-component system phosphate regulon response regulator PhoB